MSTQDNSEDNNVSIEYSSKRDDPKYLSYLVNKYVKVQLLKDTSFTGFIHCIDPVTQSLILSIPRKNAFKTTIIPGHAILDIKELSADGVELPKRLVTEESDKEINERKTQIIAWLKHNLLPVTDCEDKIIVQTVSILKPYTSIDIYAKNPVIALQIKKLMEEIPNDFCKQMNV